MIGKLKLVCQRELDQLRNQPGRAVLEITYRCNLDCQFCVLGMTSAEVQERELSTADWRGVIDQLISLGVEDFSVIGGEPFVRRDLCEIISHVDSRGAQASITTNGTMLTPERAARLVRHNLRVLTISLDGGDDLQDEIRRGTSLIKKMKKGIDAVQAARERAGSSLPWVKIHTTVCSLNVRQLSEIADLVESLGADEMSCQYLSETSPAAVEETRLNGACIADSRFMARGASLLLDDEEIEILRDQLRRIRQRRRRLKVSTRVLDGLDDQHYRTGLFPLSRCYTLRSVAVLNPYGEMTPCAHLDYSLGSIRDDTIAGIRNGARFKELDSKLSEGLYPVCHSCCMHMNNFTPGQLARLVTRRRL